MYAIITPDNSVDRYQDEPAITAKGWRCLPVTDASPALNADQMLQGPEVTVNNDTVTRTWIAVPVPPPPEVSMRQARLALLNAGLLDAVDAWAARTGGTIKVTWEYATTIRRDDPMIADAMTSLHLSSSDVDGLFRTAARL